MADSAAMAAQPDPEPPIEEAPLASTVCRRARAICAGVPDRVGRHVEPPVAVSR